MSDNVKTIKKIAQNPIFIAFYVFTTIFAGLSFEYMRNELGLKIMTVAILLVFLIVILNIVLATAFNRSINEDELDQKIQDIGNLISNNNLAWLVSEKHLQIVEMNSDVIWVFAPYLDYAIDPTTDIYRGLQRNLKRGAQYKFFMPEQPLTHKIISDFQRVHKYKKNQVEFVLIPYQEYLFHTIISIYGVTSDEPHCIESIPVEQLGVWVRMDKEHTDRMIGVGEMMIKKYCS
ncbi:MAG: hypothetical protein CMP22_06960 [Rickettsiales bacterium]|nr:hypothetical protein [Rickettsiales bacterium]|tara:strand:- start:869 stop:1567 length:699 start_codon:yes stop_codon:yes gene_type:complete